MWIILTYDISAKRNSKALKICRKYLAHVQKSVFEGEISVHNLVRLKGELQQIINCEDDQITIYEFETMKYAMKDTIGYHIMTDNIL